MKKIVSIILVINALFGYSLIVPNDKDVEKLKKIGFKCEKKETKNICLQTPDYNQIKRVQDYLKEYYNIKSLISNMGTASVNKKPKTQQSIKKQVPKNNTFKNTSNVTIPKSGYCIQVQSGASLKSMEKNFLKYSSLPLARIEKIKNYYVLRVGQSTSYEKIKNLLKEVKQIRKDAFVRKCDYIPDRIIKSSQNNISIKKNYKNTQKTVQPDLTSSFKTEKQSKNNVQIMYYYLNNSQLNKAEAIAKKVLVTSPINGYEVLAIVNMKKRNFQNACYYSSKLLKYKNDKNSLKMKRDSCYIYFLQQGYNNIEKNPKKAIRYFKLAQQNKNTNDIDIGLAYAYLNLNDKKGLYLAEKLYKSDPKNPKYFQLYTQALLQFKEYDKLKKLKNLPRNTKETLNEVEFYNQLDYAKNLLKNKQYDNAKKILNKLYAQNPNNIDVLLTLGNYYLQTNRSQTAKSYFQNVLTLDKNNIYALEGLKGVYIQEKNYSKALQIAEKLKALGVKNQNEKELKKLYYMKKAYYYKNSNPKLSLKYAKQAAKLYPKDPEIMFLLGDLYYKFGNKKEAFNYYANAYKYSDKEFKYTLRFLYSLLNYNYFDQINLILQNIDPNKLSEKEKQQLKQFYDDLYVKYSSYYLQNKQYKKAYEIANEGLNFNPENAKLYETKAWACINLNKPDCAKENFAKSLQYNKNDEKLKYGLALSLIKMKKYKEAEKILDSISNTEDPELKLKIADAYIILNKSYKAERILKQTKIKPVKKTIIYKPDLSVPNPFLNKPVKKEIILKDGLSNEINKLYDKLYKKNEKITNILFGLKARAKSGTLGQTRLIHISFPYTKLNLFYKSNKYYLILDPVYLNAGNNPNAIGSDKGIGLTAGVVFYNYSTNMEFSLGITPILTEALPPSITALIKFTKKTNNKEYALSLYRKPVKETLTSYIGNRETLTQTNTSTNTTQIITRSWGRVMQNGVKGEYSEKLDENDSLFYAAFDLAYLKGINTADNSEINAQLLYLKNYNLGFSTQDYIGFFGLIQHFKKDQSAYYYGNGVYFSPQFFALIAPRYEGYFLNNNIRNKLTIMLGPSILNDNNNNFSLSIGADVSLASQIIFSKRLSFEGGFDYRRTGTYNDFYVTLSLRYYFDNKYSYKKNNLDNIAKGLISW